MEQIYLSLLLFHGDFHDAVVESIDSAYGTALDYIVKKLNIQLIDFNYDELVRTRTNYVAAAAWSDMFQEACGTRSTQLRAMKSNLKDLNESFTSLISDYKDVMHASPSSRQAIVHSAADGSSMPSRLEMFSNEFLCLVSRLGRFLM